MVEQQPYRIVKPISPGVFFRPGTNDQTIIEDACTSQGIELTAVQSVGLVGMEVVSMDVRVLFDPMHDEMPEDPECPEPVIDFASVIKGIDRSCQEDYERAFARWAEIQRYKRALAAQDVPEVPKRKYTPRS